MLLPANGFTGQCCDHSLRDIDGEGDGYFFADELFVDQADSNLSEVNLTGADLTGANLSLADLRGANFHLCNLSGANLTDAKLIESDLAFARQ